MDIEKGTTNKVKWAYRKDLPNMKICKVFSKSTDEYIHLSCDEKGTKISIHVNPGDLFLTVAKYIEGQGKELSDYNNSGVKIKTHQFYINRYTLKMSYDSGYYFFAFNKRTKKNEVIVKSGKGTSSKNDSEIKKNSRRNCSSIENKPNKFF